MSRFAGRVAIVTGSGSGIGEETASLLAREGARCLVVDIDEAAATRVATTLAESGADAHSLRADVRDGAGCAHMVDVARSTWGRVDVLVNNAGGLAGPDGHRTPLAELSEETWDATLALNLRSVFLAMKHALPVMVEHGTGSIVNLASLAGLIGENTSTAAYATAKAGVVHLTRLAAVEYAPLGVRVNCVSPGDTLTRQNSQIEAGDAVRLSVADRHAAAARFHPMGRCMNASELAHAICFLASDHASGITGVNLAVDGGWSAK